MNILELAILKKMVGGGGGSGTDNYNDLSNLPQINGETLAGNKTAENLGLQDALTFDSTPTEDSTNPVESGGVYNALAGKQDNLTFDDDPTENSTNPVKSGGVYSALAGKQDNLTFDGVYNASTNKAATESTVTNAINGLDVSALSVDADETISSISEIDGKISVTKQDIAIASNQVVAMTGYTKPSSAPATPAIQPGDTANAAIGKLEYKADVNQTNILYALDKVGTNCASIDNLTFKAIGTIRNTSIPISNSLTGNIHVHLDSITSDDTNASTCAYILYYTDGTASQTLQFNRGVAIDLDLDIGNKILKTVDIYPSNSYSNSEADTFVLTNFMVTSKAIWDQFPTFTPPALPNYDLTRLEAEDRASLAEVVDSGAKNVYQVPATIDNDAGLTITTNPSTGTITVSGTTTKDRYIPISGNLSLYGTYIVQGCPSTGSSSTYYLHLEQSNEVGANDVGDKNYIGSTNTYNSAACKLYIRVFNGVAFGSGVTFTPIVCTKAAFGVSSKFVPYRPNWDLVCSNITTLSNRITDFATFGSQTRSFIIKRTYGTSNTRCPLQIVYGSQDPSSTPVILYTNLFSAGDTNNTPSLSKSGMCFGAGTINTTNPTPMPLPTVWFKTDTTKQWLYITVNFGYTNLWAAGYFKIENSTDQLIIDTTNGIDISSDSDATQMTLYHPTFTS